MQKTDPDFLFSFCFLSFFYYPFFSDVRKDTLPEVEAIPPFRLSLSEAGILTSALSVAEVAVLEDSEEVVLVVAVPAEVGKIHFHSEKGCLLNIAL